LAPTIIPRAARRLLYKLLQLDYSTGILSLLLLPLIIPEVKSAETVEEMISLLYSRRLARLLLAPMQIREELEALAALVAGARPSTVLEIGTARGGTLAVWTRAASSDALIITIDLPGGPFGGGYGAARIPLYLSLRRGRQRIVLLRGDSHSAATITRVKGILDGRRVEFMFIDGDHSFEGVCRDYNNYKELLAEKSILAFHDIVPGPEHMVGGVPVFWRMLKSSLKEPCKTLEIVKDWRQGGYGIGVILVREGCRLPRLSCHSPCRG